MSRTYVDYVSKFLAMNTRDLLVVTNYSHVITCLAYARKRGIGAASFKFPEGGGWGLIKLRRRVLARCPKCGYRRATGEKWWKKTM